MKIRVYFEDTDIGGIVYHTKYINFCERARSETLFINGFEPFNKESNSGYIVKNLKCNFIKSATLGDTLEIKSRVLKRTKVKFTLLQEIFKDNEKIFEMEITLIYIKDGKISRVDDSLVNLFQNN